MPYFDLFAITLLLIIARPCSLCASRGGSGCCPGGGPGGWPGREPRLRAPPATSFKRNLPLGVHFATRRRHGGACYSNFPIMQLTAVCPSRLPADRGAAAKGSRRPRRGGPTARPRTLPRPRRDVRHRSSGGERGAPGRGAGAGVEGPRRQHRGQPAAATGSDRRPFGPDIRARRRQSGRRADLRRRPPAASTSPSAAALSTSGCGLRWHTASRPITSCRRSPSTSWAVLTSGGSPGRCRRGWRCRRRRLRRFPRHRRRRANGCSPARGATWSC